MARLVYWLMENVGPEESLKYLTRVSLIRLFHSRLAPHTPSDRST